MPFLLVNRSLGKNNSDPITWVVGQQAEKHVFAISASLFLACGSHFSKWLYGFEMVSMVVMSAHFPVLGL